jgi:hypothetical protein
LTPSPRLQRTPPSALPPSPLSRKPLGARWRASRQLLPVLLISCLALGSRPTHKCEGRLLLRLSDGVNLPSDIPLKPESGDAIVLRISENGRGGWFLGAFRASDPGDGDNLLLDRGTYAAGTKFDIDAMNVPQYEDYPEPLMLPVRSTDMALCVDFAKARAQGSGAAAGFGAGSIIDVRVIGEDGRVRLTNPNFLIYVQDLDGHRLHGADVSLVLPGGRPTDSHAIHRMSNALGEAGFLTAPAGRYEAIVSLKGFITSRFGPFELSPRSVYHLSAVLNRSLVFADTRGDPDK